jgi:hypothetical protein
METCLETGNAPSVYLIEEATGSSPVAPIINGFKCFAMSPRRKHLFLSPHSPHLKRLGCLTIRISHTTLEERFPVGVITLLINSTCDFSLSSS